ncbi:MAG TPA: ABC transporter permease [Blastocatellia bacterium]|nr:ABC transporter permease [Blastocatellia bacterium]
MQTLWQDLRFSARMLLKKPGFTLIATFTLSLGIGASTVVFSLVATLVYPPLPAHEPARVVAIDGVNTRTGMSYLGVSLPDLGDWKAHSRSIEQFAALVWPGSLALAGVDRPELARGMYATASLFDVLGARPAQGRVFSLDEDRPENAGVVVISHGLWRQRFGNADDILGRSLKIEGRFYTVIGVMPPGFDLFGAQLFLPLSARPGNWAQNREARDLMVFARLGPGVSVAQSRAELETISRGLAESFPTTNRDIGARVTTLREWYGSDYKPLAALMFAAVALVLLVACANVAGLLLSRGVERQKEIAVRLALGATRWRIVRQLLTESALLALSGAALGALLAAWLVDAINLVVPFEWRYHFDVDGKSLLFALGLSGLTALFCGLLPALQASRPDMQEALKEGALKGRRSHRWLNGLVAGDVAVSFLLLVGAGLLLRSAWNFQRIDLGFDPRNTVTMWINMPEYKYRRAREVEAFAAEVLQRWQRLPAVRHAAAAHWAGLPQEAGAELGFTVEGAQSRISGDAPSVLCSAVTEDFFHARGMRLLRGRAFTGADREGAAGVVVVNERLARAFFSEGDALGRQLKLGGRDANRPWLTIIGVTADTRHPNRLELSETPLEIYIPLAQQSISQAWPADAAAMRSVSLLARVNGDPQPLKAALQKEVWAVDREQPIHSVRTMEENVRLESFDIRAMAWLFGSFALVALSLAAIGLYGLLANFVSERIREIGIRMALGAQAENVSGFIVWRGMRLVLLGAALGLLASLALSRWLESMLFGVGAMDPLTFIAIAGLLAGVAFLACWIPARRATKVDPIIALRCE